MADFDLLPEHADSINELLARYGIEFVFKGHLQQKGRQAMCFSAFLHIVRQRSVYHEKNGNK